MDSDDEDEVPDFPQNFSPGTAEDSGDSQAEIQFLIDNLPPKFEISDDDTADDGETIIYLQDLTGPVILDICPASATQDIFLKMEKLTLGKELCIL